MSVESRPRVLLADDYAGILTALTRLLEPSCEIVGSVADGRALLEAAARLTPDVVVLDLAMPELNGIVACERLKETMPAVKVVMLTAAVDDVVQRTAMRMGADAFVLKHSVVEALPGAIRQAWLAPRRQES